MQRLQVKKMTISGILMALGLVLPFLTGQIQSIARWISPMHIPVLICGLTCGCWWGCGVGFVLPLLRGILFGMPVVPHTALPMAFELAAYGLFSGLLYPFFIKAMKQDSHLIPMITALVVSMVLGRLVGGAAKALFLVIGLIHANAPFTMEVFLTSYFVSTAPGALIHILIVPAVCLALERAKLSPILVEARR